MIQRESRRSRSYIRTSGELRLSNFLLWQLAYTEFYFTDVAWPDFNREELIRAIEKYNARDRRYGRSKGGIKMFKTRLLSGIMLVIIALFTIISGGYILFFTLLAVSLIGIRELFRAMGVQEGKANILAAAGYIGAASLLWRASSWI